MRGYPHFSFWIPITLAKIYFSPIVITFSKLHLDWEAPSLSPSCGSKFCVLEARKCSFASRTQILLPKLMFPSLATQGNMSENVVSATVFPSLARPLTLLIHCYNFSSFFGLAGKPAEAHGSSVIFENRCGTRSLNFRIRQ